MNINGLIFIISYWKVIDNINVETECTVEGWLKRIVGTGFDEEAYVGAV